MQKGQKTLQAMLACGVFGGVYTAIPAALLCSVFMPPVGTIIGLVSGFPAGFVGGIIGGVIGGRLGWFVGGFVAAYLIPDMSFGVWFDDWIGFNTPLLILGTIGAVVSSVVGFLFHRFHLRLLLVTWTAEYVRNSFLRTWSLLFRGFLALLVAVTFGLELLLLHKSR